VLASLRSKLLVERIRLINRIISDLLRFGYVVGQLGKINRSPVWALIEDFCAKGCVAFHNDRFSSTRIPSGVVTVFDQRWKGVDALDQDILIIKRLYIKHIDD
jgi:hypothetical protein